MALFIRCIKPVPATRRAYSSFFSSKSGGGRYFNSAKPPKSVVPTSSGASKAKADASGYASPDANGGDVPQGTTGASRSNANGDNGNQPMKGATEVSSAMANPVISPHDSPSQTSPIPTSSFTHKHTLPVHPAVNSKDYKLHQFFSLHRPLLLLTQPTSIIFESSQTIPPLTPSQSNSVTTEVYTVPPGGLDDPPEASPEADADAARQLVRALVINRAGATTAWEHTLRRLGLDVDLDEGRVGLKKQWAREWEDVMMDSTKRKRKRKMKKHKLKKRRKATRAQRLKIGR